MIREREELLAIEAKKRLWHQEELEDENRSAGPRLNYTEVLRRLKAINPELVIMDGIPGNVGTIFMEIVAGNFSFLLVSSIALLSLNARFLTFGQAAGGFHHNGGLPGFGEYYARGFSDQIIGSYVTDAILPSLLHEDPRYFRLGTGTFWHRTYYAVSRIFVTRLDNGKSRFNITEIAGNIGVDAMTIWYYPDSQTAAKGAERFGMQLGNDTISNILTEFWPDIKHRLRPLQHRFFPR